MGLPYAFAKTGPLWHVSTRTYARGDRIGPFTPTTSPHWASVQNDGGVRLDTENAFEAGRPTGLLSRTTAVYASDCPAVIRSLLRARGDTAHVYGVGIPDDATFNGRFDQAWVHTYRDPAQLTHAIAEYWAGSPSTPLQLWEVLCSHVEVIDDLGLQFTQEALELMRSNPTGLTYGHLVQGKL